MRHRRPVARGGCGNAGCSGGHGEVATVCRAKEIGGDAAMSCKQKQKALNEAAARGSELSAELREHIGACSECRAAFAEDGALFAAIDSRLQQSVNAELP